MATEIERKFLVIVERLPELDPGIFIEQAYIPTVNGTTVRVRVADESAFLCVKSPAVNFSRKEYEFPIPPDEAREMLVEVCHEQRIAKRRHLIEHQGMIWEVDVFEGQNEGLIVAEIELQSEQQEFAMPEWIDKEVTLDPRYSNFALSRIPFTSWK